MGSTPAAGDVPSGKVAAKLRALQSERDSVSETYRVATAAREAEIAALKATIEALRRDVLGGGR